MNAKELIKAELSVLEAAIRASVNSFTENTGLPVNIRLDYEQGEPRVSGGADLWLTDVEIETACKVAKKFSLPTAAAGGTE